MNNGFDGEYDPGRAECTAKRDFWEESEARAEAHNPYDVDDTERPDDALDARSTPDPPYLCPNCGERGGVRVYIGAGRAEQLTGYREDDFEGCTRCAPIELL